VTIAKAPPEQHAHEIGDLFANYAAYVCRTLENMGIRDCDVDDICQEVFVVVHRKLASFHGGSSIKTWVYGICMKKAAEYRRAGRRKREELTAVVPDTPYAAPQSDHVELGEAKQRLARALDELDDDKRAAFVLYEFEELTLREIAETVDASINTVYSRLMAARRHVLDALGQEVP
jgi:RNA polymerase sigma-70 factor (ECF subfamily)